MNSSLLPRRNQWWLYCCLMLSLLVNLPLLAGPGADILDRKVTLKADQDDISSVLLQLEKLADVKFSYSPQLIGARRKVSISVIDEKLTLVLERLLQPLRLNYEVVGTQIILKRKNTTEAVIPLPQANQVRIPKVIITGKVSDENGQPIPGANVRLKENTSIGTTTNAEGQYSLNVPDNTTGVLVFTSVGYLPAEVSLSSQSVVDITLKAGTTSLSEVVVTALGIKKEAKKLGYSTSTVNTDQITTNRTVNLGNSLQGKVAGVNVTAPAGGPGGTSKIRIRGQSSFKGDNSPLIIVNGVPINNSNFSSRQGDSDGTTNRSGSASDGGDGLQSINQDDIQSITVLKGSTAAALYGFRAKDGAIVITTKTGQTGQGIGVEVNSNFIAERALDYTDFQYEYGQGEYGKRPQSVGDAQSSGVFSFGERFDGKPTYQFDGVQRPYLAQRHRIRDFYRTGTSWNNSVALSGGNEKGGFRISFSNMDANSIMPNSDYHKKILNLGLNYNFTPKLSVQLNANYSNEYNHNPPQIGLQDLNANTTVYTTATSVAMKTLEDNRYDANGFELATSRFTNRNNPYWVAYDRFEHVRRDRIFGNASVRYQLTDWLYAQGRIGQDYFTRPYDFNRPTGTRSLAAAATGFNGYFYQEISTFRERNLDFLIGSTHKLGVFGLDITLGGNSLQQIYTNSNVSATNFYIRDLYTIMNGQNKEPQYAYTRKQVNSLYGVAELSYKNFLFLNATARNDWFSTLNPQSNSYLYPSVSASFVLSDAFKERPRWMNFMKVRAAYAEVGGDTDPYQNNLYYNLNANSIQGQALGYIATDVSPNNNLMPLKVKEAELGLEFRTLDNRINLDVAYYNKKTVDEILNVDISTASGYNKSKVNVGQLRNKGIEVLLTLVPVKKEKFTWETTFNFTYNQSEVLALADGQARLKVGQGDFFGEVWHEVGMPMASLRGIAYKRDNQGRIITAGGKPVAGPITTFGSAIPKYTGGWINTFNVAGFKIFTQIDFKGGHKIISNSNLNFLRHGLSKESLVGREGGVLFEGVTAEGAPNTTRVEAEDFYSSYRSTNNAERFVYNASFIRWRSLSVSYDLSRFLNKGFVKSLSLSALCNNVLLIKKHLPNLDPEAVNGASDNIQGIETHTLPTTRSYGMNLNLKF
ncbi:SusC/RagA family TonB-linked outer membrane protein [Siphonobacter sp. SORGH_AS_1065]|uniref:SusC/RagA family TonB-linked outer membrane protein n=1 Tax=Siphonobacter sp. SORGH_AS_1065 TaxID=3041795 RepID=UPI0027800D26|nr:SusC/RagA family TonB-linked outer membrane protein [Siphonobacter sp. SORGH_AS_1065]MDQ1086524.1 TonB-linked SusC/RagA family outer membrane protein [Siphonobacter sp. SORGH_AS_1065]